MLAKLGLRVLSQEYAKSTFARCIGNSCCANQRNLANFNDCLVGKPPSSQRSHSLPSGGLSKINYAQCSPQPSGHRLLRLSQRSHSLPSGGISRINHARCSHQPFGDRLLRFSQRSHSLPSGGKSKINHAQCSHQPPGDRLLRFSKSLSPRL
jgi:hypothetical protein